MNFVVEAILFGSYGVASVIGLLLIKYSLPVAQADWLRGFLSAPSMLLLALGIFLYIASFLVWLVILARHELSLAYPTAVGLTLALSTVGAAFILGEALSIVRLTGILAIFIGIYLVTRF